MTSCLTKVHVSLWMMHPGDDRIGENIKTKTKNPEGFQQNPNISNMINLRVYPVLFQVAVLSLTLFPLRLLCLFILVLVASLIAVLTTACMKKEEEPQPFKGYRRYVGITFSL